MKTEIKAYTDGACSGNPGPGGWGILLRYGEHEKRLYGGELNTTNNRMELTAAITALETLKRPCRVLLTTDSEYLRKGMTEWLSNWIRRGWRTVDKKPVKNQDLWERLYQVSQIHEIEWRWVRGHTGHPENEAADALARKGIQELLTAMNKQR